LKALIDPEFPLIDLHRHLDGSVRLETILDLGRKHNLPLPAWDIEALRPHVQVTKPTPGLMAYIAKFKWMVGVLVDYDACHRIAYENVEDAAREGIDYIELRFSPYFMAEHHGLDPEGVVEAVVAGAQSGEKEFRVSVNLIGIISRTYGVNHGWIELNALLSQREHLVGLDLAGDEVNFPANLFIEHFNKGRAAGWEITVHAGEAAGAESIWQAIDDLGATRIGHAVRAIDDPRLMDVMLQKQIGIEANLTSNLHTSIVPELSHHPARTFLDRGLLVTLNTDNIGVSGIDLAHEYTVAAPAAGLSQDQILQTQHNALAIAFLSDEEKTDLIRRKKKSN
jgi:adenosine deaminase